MWLLQTVSPDFAFTLAFTGADRITLQDKIRRRERKTEILASHKERMGQLRTKAENVVKGHDERVSVQQASRKGRTTTNHVSGVPSDVQRLSACSSCSVESRRLKPNYQRAGRSWKARISMHRCNSSM